MHWWLHHNNSLHWLQNADHFSCNLQYSQCLCLIMWIYLYIFAFNAKCLWKFRFIYIHEHALIYSCNFSSRICQSLYISASPFFSFSFCALTSICEGQRGSLSSLHGLLRKDQWECCFIHTVELVHLFRRAYAASLNLPFVCPTGWVPRADTAWALSWHNICCSSPCLL